MVSGRVLRAAGCSHCRASILKLFITPPATPLIRASHVTAASWRTAAITSRATRSYASTSHQGDSDQKGNALQELDQAESLEAASDEQTSSQTPPASAQDDTPWYLQVEPPAHMPVSEPAPLPDVPEGSPPIIPALLKYASEEMGLDDLSLLDLRALDPPPALGENLFMLFGTARSERHLNVSAGRLVRWLRAKHRVYADADGLLGPNERKTKLRRKAKRAKLLGTMGTDETDDGMTTGWICVNLGTINRSYTESAVVGEDGRVTGFGVPQTGTTIVVQVMTESRRAELGLETLWQRTLDRQSEEQQRAKELATNDVAESQPLGKTVLSQTPSRPSLDSSASVSSPFTTQTRSYSITTDRSRDIEQLALSGGATSAPAVTDGETGIELMEFFNTPGSREDSTDSSFLDDLSASTSSALSEKLTHDIPSKVRMMELLRINLKSLTPAEAFTTLKSSTFRKISQMAMHNLPGDQTWALRLSIETRARQLGLAEFGSLDTTRRLINELRLSAIPASREEFLQLLSCIYASPGPEPHEQTSLAMDLLESAHTRGHPVITNDVIVSIIEGMSWSKKPTQEARELQASIEDLMVQAKLPYMGEPLLIRLMDAYSRLGQWDQFWATWRMPPQHAQPRSKDLYLHIYKLATATNNPAVCTETLRRCFQEMIMENPAVELVGEVRDAILQCIRVADPKAEEHANTIPATARGIARALVNREFVRLIKELKIVRSDRSQL